MRKLSKLLGLLLTFFSINLLFCKNSFQKTNAAEIGTEITTVDNIESGGQYYIKGVRSKTTYYLTFPDEVKNSQAGTESSSKSSAILITFSKVSDGVYTLKTPNGNYIAPGNSNGKIKVSSTALNVNVSDNDDNNLIKISYSYSDTEWSIQKNVSGANFGGYKNTQSDVSLIFQSYSSSLAHEKFKDLPTQASLSVSYVRTQLTPSTVETENFTNADFYDQGKGTSGGNISCTKNSVTVSSANGYGNTTEAKVAYTQLYKDGSLVISSSGANVSRVVITSVTSTYTCQAGFSKPSVGETTIKDEVLTWTGSVNSISFNASGKQVRITNIEVQIGTKASYSYSYNSVYLRFGIDYSNFSGTLFREIEAEASGLSKIATYGVAICQGDTWNESNAKTGTNDYVPFGKDNNSDGIYDMYQFFMVLKGITNYSQKYIAKAYVKIGETKYYAKVSNAFSIQSIALDYVTNHYNDPVVSDHLGMLDDLKNATYVAA